MKTIKQTLMAMSVLITALGFSFEATASVSPNINSESRYQQIKQAPKQIRSESLSWIDAQKRKFGQDETQALNSMQENTALTAMRLLTLKL